MNKHYDGIDIFFIITISFYFIILFLFVSTFLLNYLELIHNEYSHKHLKKTIPKQAKKIKNNKKEIPYTRIPQKIYKSNISYVD